MGTLTVSKFFGKFNLRKWGTQLMNKNQTLSIFSSRGLHADEYQTELSNQTSKDRDTIGAINEIVKAKSHGRLFAVVYLAGVQFKITEEDVILIQGYWAPDIGDRIRLEKVMLTGSSDFTLLGRPLLPRDLVRIEGTVIEKTLSHNKMHCVIKKGEDYRRLRFMKVPYSMLRINLIQFDGLVDEVKDVEGLRQTVLW